MTGPSSAGPGIARRAALTTVVALAGCVPSLPGQGPAPRTFRATPKYTFASDLPKAKWSLAVAEPVAERTLDTNRILVLTNGTNVDYVALAFWIDRAPAMVQTLIVQSFRNSGRLVQVGTNRDRVRPQFQLISDLRAFQLNRGNGPDIVHVVLQAQLLRMPERDTVGRESFAADRPPIGTGIDAVVEAFDEALGRVMKELVSWTIKTGNKDGA